MHGSGPEEVGPPGPRMEASYPPAEGAETAVRTQGRAWTRRKWPAVLRKRECVTIVGKG